MKRIILIAFAFAFGNQNLFAQDEFDVLRYAQNNIQGTARSSAIGGALGSIGGDMGALIVNPAGIGIFRKSEFSLSANYAIARTSGTYLGTTRDDNANKLSISHFGYVKTRALTSDQYKQRDWKSISFGFGMNRLASFANNSSYTGKNTKSSIVERWADDFNRLGGINDNSLGGVNYSAYSAYRTYLIDRDYTVGGDTNRARSYVPFKDGIQQTKSVSESGGMNEYFVSLGGNYKEKLMLGATMGIPTVNYTRSKSFIEEDVSNNLNNDFKYMRFNENLVTSGVGLNLKLGAIYKANKNFRAGIALHTPSRIWMNDAVNVSMETHTDSFLLRNNISSSPISKYNQDSTQVFNYSQTTPYKAIVSASYLFDKYGFITADIEYMDYSTMKYNYGEGFENLNQVMNTQIAALYKSAVNIRIGAEAKLKDFSLRAGYANYGSPNRFAEARNVISGGVGYRTNTWFMDLTYIAAMQNNFETPYILERTDANVTQANLDNRRSNLVFTFGWKFR